MFNVFVEVKRPELTQKYTKVLREKDFQFNTPHSFRVIKAVNNKIIQHIHFQEGPIKENGVNGVTNEDLIAMVLVRLESFQESEFKCEENAKAIEYLLKTLEVLRSRTTKREIRGVEGTNVV